MANKTIPELSEIVLADLLDSHLLVLETSTETHKLRLDTTLDFIFYANRFTFSVVYDGATTGVKTVNVGVSVPDARLMVWALKKPTTGEQITAVIATTDAATVTIDTGDFALAAGTYTLLGV